VHKSLLNVVLLDQFPDQNAKKPVIPIIESLLKPIVPILAKIVHPVVPIVEVILKPVTPVVAAIKRKLSIETPAA
jgi:hypothetical protein